MSQGAEKKSMAATAGRLRVDGPRPVRRPNPRELAEDHVLQRALRDLVRDAASHLPLARETEELVLSVEHDGVLYSLAQRRLPASSPQVSLSAREQEIARMIATGHTNRTVAAVLDVSPWTVDTHVRRIFAKLGVRSRSAMIARLVDEGMLGRVQ